MTRHSAPRRGRGRGERTKRFAAAATTPLAVGTAAVLLAGGGTYALWSSEGTFLGGTFTAGDLFMVAGTPTWAQITPGVDPGASGNLATTPPDFHSMPGDVVQLRLPVTTTLKGDNLNAGFSVDFANPGAVSQDVADGLISVAYHVEDADGFQVAPATGQTPLGVALPVPGLVGDDDGEVDSWTVVVTVEVFGEYRWVTDETDDVPGSWAAGDLVVRLEQVRAGSGFHQAGGAQ